MRRILFLSLCLSLVAAQSAAAQRVEPVGVSSPRSVATVSHAPLARTLSLSPAKTAADLPGNSGMPRWVRWGLVGAVGGAALFVLADGLNSGNHSVGSSLLAGAATGFVVVGGGVLVYDAICSNGSRRSGC